MCPHLVAVDHLDLNLLRALISYVLWDNMVVILLRSRNRLQSDSEETIILSFDWEQLKQLLRITVYTSLLFYFYSVTESDVSHRHMRPVSFLSLKS